MLKKNPWMIALMAGLCCLFLAPVFPSAAQSPAEVRALLTAYTSGEISRDSKIRVVFVNELATPQQINVPLPKSPFNFKPTIDGTAIWTDTRTLSFQPRNRLPSGLAYRATLDLEKILPTTKIKSFDFQFNVVKQRIELTINGLHSDGSQDLKHLQLDGHIRTNDTALDNEITQFIKARQGDKPLEIQWTHSADLKEHDFTLKGILKADNSSRLTIQWDGSALQANQKGSKTLEVPALGPFTVLQARPVLAQETYLEVYFSDPLDKSQDLRGLIQIADTNADTLRYKLQGSIVQVYPTSGWTQSTLQINVKAGIRNVQGARLSKAQSFTVSFEEMKPAVRFIGDRTIIPTTRGQIIPVETVNLRAIVVKITQIHTNNVPQFFQVNNLNGQEELHRVGSNIIKRVIPLNFNPAQKNQWVRHALDLAPLMQRNPGGFYRFELYFLQEHAYVDCSNNPPDLSQPLQTEDLPLDGMEPAKEVSSWDSYEQSNQNSSNNSSMAASAAASSQEGGEEEGEGEGDENEVTASAPAAGSQPTVNPNDPCRPEYYSDSRKTTVVKNVLISDIGLIAKKGSTNELYVAVTDIRSARPLAGVKLILLDFQQQVLAQADSDAKGLAVLRGGRVPFLLVAQFQGDRGKQYNYLKLEDGAALAVSHFDVAGQTSSTGIKGLLYGERGVWRPGDMLYLTFILFDNDRKLPVNHPVIFELQNPRGQVVKKMVNKEPLNGFYAFHVRTDPDAPTGNWTASIKVGGNEFKKILKIETVQPNRLKIKMDFGKDVQSLTGGRIAAKLSAIWLHGAIAKNLKADVHLVFSPLKTTFPKYEEYVFDDPVRRYEPEKQTIFEGNLDEKGESEITAEVETRNDSPGLLSANFETRVFESGGTFSTDYFALPYHPYEHYVGIRTPKGDVSRGMLLTDTKHIVQVALLNPQGNPVPKGQVEITLYKINWRWWWEKGEESFADFVSSSAYKKIQSGMVQIKDGKGDWQFEVKYPDWGRYMLRARDLDGNHYTGKIVYIDWPGWAGRAQSEMPGGASVLSFSADKVQYQVGEKVTLTIPTAKQGRGLVSLETGSKILKTDWVEAGATATRYEFIATEAMAPYVYAHVTFLQPHLQTLNDLPIRLYGVIPIRVENPQTHLMPMIEAPPEFTPESSAKITVSEKEGRPMTYTLAMVDEGLLDLTRFKTPDPWQTFYMRDALGVKTWDIYDLVAGAYGGILEQLLAIGGDEEGEQAAKRKATGKKAQRFPPVVRFLGPFSLKAQAKEIHEIQIPQYVGSVRLMVVAGQDGAFGFQEKTAFVRKPLMLLATLPRVLGPQEDIKMPISVFAMDPKIKNVAISAAVEGPLTIVGPTRKFLTFKNPSDEMVTFDLRTEKQIGLAKVKIEATGSDITARQTIEIDVRLPSSPITVVLEGVTAKNQTWKPDLKYFGLPGTNRVVLEVSRIPPLNLEKRLGYLILYPHGCIEQTTSSVFPQVYLNKLLELPEARKTEIERNIKAGIERLRLFQTSEGGFSFWPGQGPADYWGSCYAGHFLVEAEKVGYLLPPAMLEQWKQYQRRMADNWNASYSGGDLIQAYRLYTLALAGAPELGAMNRLRETSRLSATAGWQLAAAYQLAGQPEAAIKLARDAGFQVTKYRELSNTYGSDLRDKAMILEALSLMGRLSDAKSLAKEITERLNNNQWLSTQETAYALIAMARHVGMAEDPKKTDAVDFSFTWNGSKPEKVTSSAPLVQKRLTVRSEPKGDLALTNLGGLNLYTRLIVQGAPMPGNEKAAEEGLSIDVDYVSPEGQTIDPYQLEQGADFIAAVTVKHNGNRGAYYELALSHLFPSGWEIHNTRMIPGASAATEVFNYQDIRDDRVYTYFNLKEGESKTFKVYLTAAYLGRFYMPLVSVEAMYDTSINARVKGAWVEVVKPEN